MYTQQKEPYINTTYNNNTREINNTIQNLFMLICKNYLRMLEMPTMLSHESNNLDMCLNRRDVHNSDVCEMWIMRSNVKRTKHVNTYYYHALMVRFYIEELQGNYTLKKYKVNKKGCVSYKNNNIKAKFDADKVCIRNFHLGMCRVWNQLSNQSRIVSIWVQMQKIW